MKALTLHRVFDGKADGWKEWKEDLDEFWELHHPGTNAGLRDLMKTVTQVSWNSRSDTTQQTAESRCMCFCAASQWVRPGG